MPSKLHDTFAAYARANTLPSDLDLSGARFERDRMHILSHGHAFPGVQDLSLSRCLMYEHCPALLAACHGLETLDLSDNPWLMASSLRPLPRLRHLKLSRTLTSVEALQEILTRSWDALETLELERCGLSEGGLDVLLETSHLPALRALRVGQNPISLQRVQSLFDAPNLPALEHVHFHKQHLNPALLARLDAIGAAEHDLTVEGVELLGRLGDCMSEDALRRVVAWLDVKTQADTLDLSDTTFSGQALPMLAKASGARHIYTLNLARCGLRSEDLQAWFSTTAFNHIQSLDLSGNPLGEGAASAFLGIQLWNLRHLWLRDIGLTDSAIAPMEFWYFARHLLTLELAGNHFSPAGYAQLSTFQNFPEALRATFEP